jgi:hypothetical protein
MISVLIKEIGNDQHHADIIGRWSAGRSSIHWVSPDVTRKSFSSFRVRLGPTKRTAHPFKEFHKEYSSDTSTGPSSLYKEFTLSNTVTFYQYL